MSQQLWPLVPLTVLLQCVLSLASILYLRHNRVKAKQGDPAAAQVVILPNFRYLLWTCLVCQLVHLVLVGHALTQMPDWKKRSRFESHQVTLWDTSLYFTAILVTSIEYNAAGALLVQNSLAKSAFKSSRTWATIWGFVFAFFSSLGFYSNSNIVFFTVLALFGSHCFCFCPRRNCMFGGEIDGIFYSLEIFFYVFMIVSALQTYKEVYHTWVAFRSLLFPIILYHTLLRKKKV
eukprot:jgi/Bigna1/80933/fgenesh1_pg.76_\